MAEGGRRRVEGGIGVVRAEDGFGIEVGEGGIVFGIGVGEGGFVSEFGEGRWRRGRRRR